MEKTLLNYLTARGKGLSDLSRESGLSINHLSSRVNKRNANLTKETMNKIARATEKMFGAPIKLEDYLDDVYFI